MTTQIEKLEAERDRLTLEINAFSAQINAIREKRAPKVDERSAIELTISAARRLAETNPEVARRMRELQGDTIAADPVATSASVTRLDRGGP